MQRKKIVEVGEISFHLFIYLFICSLFNDIVSNSNCSVSNNRVISEYWIWKYVKGSSHDFIRGANPELLGRTKGKPQELQRV
jgi:hypothetical protein